jgi:hypothetical protein
MYAGPRPRRPGLIVRTTTAPAEPAREWPAEPAREWPAEPAREWTVRRRCGQFRGPPGGSGRAGPIVAILLSPTTGQGADVRVFISWSGEPSRSIARALADWLGGLVQAVEPWVSDAEIGSGQRWRDEVAAVLDETDFGIICLTRHNQHNPWLMFESGALAKRLSSARVVPLYIDLEPAEVTGPLADWQGRPLHRDGMWRIVSDINKATKKPVSEVSLERLFDRMWPDLEDDVATARQGVSDAVGPPRTTEEMLEELVERVRRLEQQPGARAIVLTDARGSRAWDPHQLQALKNVRLVHPQGLGNDMWTVVVDMPHRSEPDNVIYPPSPDDPDDGDERRLS